MKYLANLLALAFLISVGACSSEGILTDEPSINEGTGITEISAVIGKLQYEDTRTAVTMGDFNSSSINLVWAEKDTIGIYPTEGDQLSFPIVEGVGTNKCTFNGGGWALKNSTSYKAYSPFNRAYYYHDSDKLPVSMLGQKQIGNSNSDHLGKYDLQIAEGKTPETGKISFDFKHQVCFIRMDLTAPIAASWESITLVSDASFYTEATMNLVSTPTSLEYKSSSNRITLELENVTTTSDNTTITAFMVVLPVDLTGKSLNISLTDSEGNSFVTEAIIANDYRNFKAGYARWIKGDFLTPANNQLWYTTINNKVATPYAADAFGASITSNTYENGKGIIKFSEDITTIGNNAFYDCDDLVSIVIPTSVTTIGENAFSNCYELTNITLPNNLKTIEKKAFYYSTSLSEIIIPNSVTTIGEYAFCGCGLDGTLTIPNNVTSVGTGAFCENYFSKVVIPNSMTSIPPYAFSKNISLTDVTIPNSVTTIGEHAFDNCTKLTTITIPNSVTTIGASAFYYCTSLSEITIPNSVSTIGESAFCYCTKLTNITIPNSVTSIGTGAFSRCSLLNNVVIPNSIKTISGSTFYYCKKLTDITIPNSVESIEEKAFEYCESLKIITIPNSVTTIGANAFMSVQLEEIHVEATNPPSIYDITSFSNTIYSNCKVYVPKGKIETYKTASIWSNFTNIIGE